MGLWKGDTLIATKREKQRRAKTALAPRFGVSVEIMIFVLYIQVKLGETLAGKVIGYLFLTLI
jgi:hypothetical protein